MKVLIRDSETGKFYGRNGHWTSSQARAQIFETAVAALQKSLNSGLVRIELVSLLAGTAAVVFDLSHTD